MQETELEATLIEVFKNDDIKDLTSDATELLIDATLKDGLLKEIPLVGTVTHLLGIAGKISAQSFQKKILKFLVQSSNIPRDKKVEFIIELEDITGDKAGAFLIDYIEKLDNSHKIDLFANLLISRTDNNISLDQFLRLSHIVSKTYWFDLLKLPEYRQIKFTHHDGYNRTTAETLAETNLVETSTIQNPIYAMDEKNTSVELTSEVTVMPLGVEIIKYAFRLDN